MTDDALANRLAHEWTIIERGDALTPEPGMAPDLGARHAARLREHELYIVLMNLPEVAACFVVSDPEDRPHSLGLAGGHVFRLFSDGQGPGVTTEFARPSELRVSIADSVVSDDHRDPFGSDGSLNRVWRFSVDRWGTVVVAGDDRRLPDGRWRGDGDACEAIARVAGIA